MSRVSPPKPAPLRHAHAHTGRAQWSSAASCHEPHIPFIRERRRSVCPSASITVLQRAAQGHEVVRFTLGTPCAALCFRLRIHLLSLTLLLAKAIGLSVQWRQQAQVARRLSGPIRDLMASPSASLDRLPGGMTKMPSEGECIPPLETDLGCPMWSRHPKFGPINTRVSDINIWRRRPAGALHLARSLASRDPCPDFETTLPRFTQP